MALDWRLWLSVAAVLLVILLGFTVAGNAERADAALDSLARSQARADRLEVEVDRLREQVAELTAQIADLEATAH